MPTRNSNLTRYPDRFIDAEVSSGLYGNAREVVHEGPRLMERRRQEDQARLQWLRGAIQQGLDEIDLGEGLAVASLDQLEELVDQIGGEASAVAARAANMVEVGTRLRIFLAPSARNGTREALNWNRERYGKRAVPRYRELLKQTPRDIAADPKRPGSLDHPDIAPVARTFHFSFRRHWARGPLGVDRKPRHPGIYRCRGPEEVDLVRSLRISTPSC